MLNRTVECLLCLLRCAVDGTNIGSVRVAPSDKRQAHFEGSSASVHDYLLNSINASEVISVAVFMWLSPGKGAKCHQRSGSPLPQS